MFDSAGWWRRRIVAVGMAAVALSCGTSCEGLEDALRQQCSSVENSFRSALEEETTRLESPDELGSPERRPAHLGLTLSDDLISRLANVAVRPALEAALEIASTIRIQGQSVELETEGDVVDLQVAADESCDHCFELTASLGGVISARNPTFGARRANLDGSIRLVAPLLLEEGDEKSAAVKFDLGAALENGLESVGAGISDPDGNVPETLRSEIRGVLSRIVERTLGEQLREEVTLVEFDGPSFGLEGFELTPVALRSDGGRGAVFAGFSANIAALNGESVEGIESVTDLGDRGDVALSVQPDLIVRTLSLLMGEGSGSGRISRAYDRAGRAVEGGSYRVVLEDFRAGSSGDVSRVGGADAADVSGGDSPGSSSESTPFGLGFSVHRFGAGGVCFSAGARARGEASVRDGAIGVGIREVEFTGEGVPEEVLDLANWSSAQFVEETTSLFEASVDGENLEVPGTGLDIGPIEIGLRPNTVVLRGRSRTGDLGEGE